MENEIMEVNMQIDELTLLNEIKKMKHYRVWANHLSLIQPYDNYDEKNGFYLSFKDLENVINEIKN